MFDTYCCNPSGPPACVQILFQTRPSLPGFPVVVFLGCFLTLPLRLVVLINRTQLLREQRGWMPGRRGPRRHKNSAA